jgi:hypothetical protein
MACTVHNRHSRRSRTLADAILPAPDAARESPLTLRTKTCMTRTTPALARGGRAPHGEWVLDSVRLAGPTLKPFAALEEGRSHWSATRGGREAVRPARCGRRGDSVEVQRGERPSGRVRSRMVQGTSPGNGVRSSPLWHHSPGEPAWSSTPGCSHFGAHIVPDRPRSRCVKT